jgi:hypothetical protein
MRKAALAVMSLIAAGFLAAGAFAGKPAGPQCWTSPSQLASGQSYSVSASGLPTNGPVNLVVFYPNGNRLTIPATPSADGGFSLQAAPGSTFQATETGSYTFKFVGKVSWPSGDWNKEFATCSMQVS